MIKFLDTILIGLSSLFLVACGSLHPQKTLYVDSYPQGATLVEWGSKTTLTTPTQIPYNADPYFIDGAGCLHVRSFQVVWPSGVARRISDLDIFGETSYLESGAPELDFSGYGTPLEAPHPLRLCGNRQSWTLVIERPQTDEGLEYDLANAEYLARQRELQALDDQIQREKGNAALAEGLGTLMLGITCAASGGCASGSGFEPDLDYRRDRPRMAPDGSFVIGEPKLCPDGSFVGGSRCVRAPDGSFIGAD